MIYLSIEKDTKDLYLFINSPGGWVISGMAIYDTMQFVRPDVQTICMGLAASIASFILVGGKTNTYTAEYSKKQYMQKQQEAFVTITKQLRLCPYV